MNYKKHYKSQSAIKEINFNGVVYHHDTTTRLVHLTATGNTGTAVTCHDSKGGANYQVPTGYKFTVIYIVDFSGGHADDAIMYADNADGNTNEVDLLTGGTAMANKIFVSAEAPAGKYINMIDLTTSAIEFYGIEELA